MKLRRLETAILYRWDENARHDVWVIDQVWGQDGWILASFFQIHSALCEDWNEIHSAVSKSWACKYETSLFPLDVTISRHPT